MKHKDRAYRRHQIERRRRQVLAMLAQRAYRTEIVYDDAAIGRAVHTRTPCSSWLCGNQRRWWGASTVQERRAAEAARV
jgi:hypothetical protein